MTAADEARRAVLLVLDGAADRPAAALGRATPLEAARTPNLDGLAALGTNGTFFALDPYLAPSTDHAHFVMLGYDATAYPGRGYVEALARGLDLAPDDTVLRDLFLTAERHGSAWIVERERVPFDEEECEELSSAVTPFEHDGIRLEHVYTGRRHGFLVMRRAGTTDFSDTDPFFSGLPVLRSLPLRGAADPLAARRAASALNAFTAHAHRALSAHPVNRSREAAGLPPINFVVAKWPGAARPQEAFATRTGMRGAVVAGSELFRGLASLLGLDFVATPPARSPEEEARALVEAALGSLSDYDFILLHTKEPDEAGHVKDPARKAEVLEAIDRGLGGLLELAASRAADVVVTADHGTPSSGPLLHAGDPAPFTLVSTSIAPDSVAAFNERAVARGALGTVLGRDLMPLVLHVTGRSRYRGSRPYDRDWPGRASLDRVVPFEIPE